MFYLITDEEIAKAPALIVKLLTEQDGSCVELKVLKAQQRFREPYRDFMESIERRFGKNRLIVQKIDNESGAYWRGRSSFEAALLTCPAQDAKAYVFCNASVFVPTQRNMISRLVDKTSNPWWVQFNNIAIAMSLHYVAVSSKAWKSESAQRLRRNYVQETLPPTRDPSQACRPINLSDFLENVKRLDINPKVMQESAITFTFESDRTPMMTDDYDDPDLKELLEREQRDVEMALASSALSPHNESA